MSSPAPVPTSSSAGSTLAALIGELDHRTCPLGPIAHWPESLKLTTEIMLRSAAQIVLFWGPDLVALYNDAYATTIGNKHPRALGRPARENWAELWDDLEPLLRGVLETGETFAARDRPFYIERHGYGEAAYFDVSYSAVPDADGRTGGVLCIVSETTDRMRADQRVRDSEVAMRASETLARAQTDQLAAIYDVSPIGLAVLDRELRYVRINDLLAEWNGIPAADHIGRTVQEIVPGLAEQAIALFERVLAGEPLWGIEIVGPTRGRPDGQSTWRENWVPLRDESGEIVGIAVSCEDVTDERRAQRAVETLNKVGAALAAEHDLERLVQLVTDAGVELSSAAFGAFFYNVVDRSGESYLLYSLSGVEREAFAGFPMPRNTAVFGPTFGGEGVVRSDDITADPRYGLNTPHRGMPEGHLPVCSYLAVPVVGREGKVLGGLFFGHHEAGRFGERHEELLVNLAGQAAVAIENAQLLQRVRDANEELEQRISERTAQLTEAHDALRQAQKMEAMGQLTGGVAHDFNNLLTPIIGSLDLLRRRNSDDERASRLLEGALQSAERASVLVQRLLAFARRQPLNPTAVDVTALVEGLEALLASTLGPQIRIEIDAAADLPHARADENQLEMALLNLSVNARDAMPAGGTLRISISACDVENGDARLASGRYVRLTVADTGSGMDAETLERAIEPFFSTKGVGRGTGLGLSMVHGLASQLGGALLLESAPGEGTAAELWLPACGRGSAAAKTAEPAAPLQRSGRVLLVDDEDAVRETAFHMLDQLGYVVTEARSAEDALGLIEQGLRPDILVSDHLMPEMSGTDLARGLLLQMPQLKVLIVSGYAEREALAVEFAHLAKPFRAADLADALARLD